MGARAAFDDPNELLAVDWINGKFAKKMRFWLANSVSDDSTMCRPNWHLRQKSG